MELGVGVVDGLVKKGGRLEDGWRMEDGKGFGLRIKKKGANDMLSPAPGYLRSGGL